MGKSLTYFVADVHLGLDVNDPKAREARFVDFLRSLPAETDALYLLGDIWDFWYEYRDVVPKGYVRVLAALTELMDRGVKLYFFQGNHDVWTYSYFEDLGMRRLTQPALIDIQGKKFCLGHGDGLGPVSCSYKFIRAVFHNSFLQFMFSLLHPWLAFRLATAWSKSSRLSHDKTYSFKGEKEPLCIFAEDFCKKNGQVDHFIFGHYHDDAHVTLSSGAKLHVLKDWMNGSSYICFDGEEIISISQE